MRKNKKPTGKHDDGSFEDGEGAAEAILDATLDKPPGNTLGDSEGEGGELKQDDQEVALTRECPPADDRGDKTPAVFKWHCRNSPRAEVEAKYIGRKVNGELVTSAVIEAHSK